MNISLYDSHLELKCIPFVENAPPRGMEQLQAQDIMVKPVVTFTEVARAGHVFEVLKSVSHNGFPVVNKRGKLVGMILRNQILVLLKKRVFIDSADGKVVVGRYVLVASSRTATAAHCDSHNSVVAVDLAGTASRTTRRACSTSTRT